MSPAERHRWALRLRRATFSVTAAAKGLGLGAALGLLLGLGLCAGTVLDTGVIVFLLSLLLGLCALGLWVLRWLLRLCRVWLERDRP